MLVGWVTQVHFTYALRPFYTKGLNFRALGGDDRKTRLLVPSSWSRTVVAVLPGTRWVLAAPLLDTAQDMCKTTNSVLDKAGVCRSG